MDTQSKIQFDQLVTLLNVATNGAFAIALYDRLSTRREMAAGLRQRVSHHVYDVSVSEHERNPIDLIRNLNPSVGDVICLFDIERAFPDVLGFLDLQREVLTDLQISVVVWTTTYEHRELAERAPNFYAFRSSVFDFTTKELAVPSRPVFIGRGTEVTQLSQMLKTGGCVVVSGLGGVGKTALAHEAMRQTQSNFASDAVWINCETSPLLGDIIFTSLGVLVGDVARQYRPDEQRKRLDDLLSDQHCLIVLDNFETIAEDGEVIRWLKTIKSPSTVLITSRISIPSVNASRLKLSELEVGDAVALFSERAKASGWEGEEANVIPALCELIGNLPLAIELIAPRAAELHLSVLTEVVQKNLASIAEEKDPTRDERHQSIFACFRVSFERLSEDARNLLMRLSLLPDGASEQIIAPYTEITEWQRPISECLRQSLMDFDGTRYRMHPLVRQFAIVQLGDNLKQWQRRVIEFYVDVVKIKETEDQKPFPAILDVEWRNIIGATELANQLNDLVIVRKLARRLILFFEMRGRWISGEKISNLLLQVARKTGTQPEVADALNDLVL